MARYLPYLLLFFSIALFGSFALILGDVSGAQVKHRNEQRAKDIVYILDKVEASVQENKSLPGINDTILQIGTETSGCALHTESCDIITDRCVNLHNLMQDRDLSLPSDVKMGTYYKTGYAAQYNSNTQVVTITACGAEKGERLSAQRSLKEALTRSVTSTGSSDAKK